MVPMVMTVDDVLDRNFETAGEFCLKPSREVRIDRVAENDALRGDQKHRAMVVVDRGVDAATDLLDRATWRGRRLGKDVRGKEQHRAHTDQHLPRRRDSHRSLLYSLKRPLFVRAA